MACSRRSFSTISEMQTDQSTSQPAQPDTKRPALTVLDVQLEDGPLAGEMTVRGSLDMERLDENKVFDLLTDHERSPEIFRAILDVSTAHQPDGSIRLTQNCRWKFLIFSGSFPVELEVVEDPASRSFTFKDVRQGGLMEKMEGEWTVGGSEVIPGGVRVEHRLTVKMAIAAPPPFDAQTNKIFVNQVNDIMTDLQLAMEEKSAVLKGPVVSECVLAETRTSDPVNVE